MNVNRKVVKNIRNLLGVFVCTLFLGDGAFKPANATLVDQNIEVLTRNEISFGHCKTAGGHCFRNGKTYFGVSIR